MGIAFNRQGQSYGVVTIVLEKGHTHSRTSIRYDVFLQHTNKSKL